MKPKAPSLAREIAPLSDARAVWASIDWSLLLFFASLFEAAR